MNSTKFIGRYLALAATFAGLSAPAFSFQVCGQPVTCAPRETGPFTVSPQPDTTGVLPVPENPVQFPLQVAQFNRNAEAAIHGTTPDKIILKRVEVTLDMDPVFFSYMFTNTVSGPCILDFDYNYTSKILANATVNTPELSANLNFDFVSPVLQNGDSVTRTLADYPGNAAGVMVCNAQTSNLAPWIGNGVVTWQYQLFGARSDTGCTQGNTSFSSTAKADVSVKYVYCVAPGDTITGGCVCPDDSPDYRRPGSLLLFPEFDSNPGSFTVVTVTNTDCLDTSTDGGDIDVEFVYRDEQDCSEIINRTVTLTPCDTLTLLTSTHTGPNGRGFMYAFAKDKDAPTGGNPNGQPVAWNHLIGSLVIIDAIDVFDYSMNPVAFQSPFLDRTPTDLDNDGLRDLDEREYEAAPNIITIPRFFGQDAAAGALPTEFNSELILIGLSGGERFDTTVCLTFWNDNEVAFSGEHTFTCWDKPFLLDISLSFGEAFLDTTDNALNEIFGASARETGWLCVEGCVANSTGPETIQFPAIYAALVEHAGPFGVADLPWECGRRVNGTLVPRSIFGDGDDLNGDGQAEPPVAGDNM